MFTVGFQCDFLGMTASFSDYRTYSRSWQRSWYVNFNPSACVVCNHALRDPQIVCALTKVSTVLKRGISRFTCADATISFVPSSTSTNVRSFGVGTQRVGVTTVTVEILALIGIYIGYEHKITIAVSLSWIQQVSQNVPQMFGGLGKNSLSKAYTVYNLEIMYMEW